jgi:hypothetical protein
MGTTVVWTAIEKKIIALSISENKKKNKHETVQIKMHLKLVGSYPG